MSGSDKQDAPKITDAAIIDLERFFAPKNSPRYAKIIEEEPDIQRPLKNLNKIICHRLFDKLERTDAKNADNDAIINVIFLPYESPRIPHVCDVKIIP